METGVFAALLFFCGQIGHRLSIRPTLPLTKRKPISLTPSSFRAVRRLFGYVNLNVDFQLKEKPLSRVIDLFS